MDCSLPGSSVHGISQASILEQVAISSSREFVQTHRRYNTKNERYGWLWTLDGYAVSV